MYEVTLLVRVRKAVEADINNAGELAREEVCDVFQELDLAKVEQCMVVEIVEQEKRDEEV
jgi:hypothetical protein